MDAYWEGSFPVSPSTSIILTFISYIVASVADAFKGLPKIRMESLLSMPEFTLLLPFVFFQFANIRMGPQTAPRGQFAKAYMPGTQAIAGTKLLRYRMHELCKNFAPAAFDHVPIVVGFFRQARGNLVCE